MDDFAYDNFLGLPPEMSAYETAGFAVLPIPYDATTSFGGGTRLGPRAILTASQQVELYDEALGREVAPNVATLPPVAPCASGPEGTLRRVRDAAAKVVKDGKFLIGLGGEHSVTAPLVEAVRSRHRDLTVLQIDAHADLRDTYQGTPHSHACVMRRVHDLGIKAVAVGIRNYCGDEAEFIRDAKPPIFHARDVQCGNDWFGAVTDHLGNEVYVTVDIDGFDPAYAPGTGTPEPGGLNWYQVTGLLAHVAAKRRIVALDVVEVYPAPPTSVTEFLAARLIHRVLGLVTA
ncbi:MAG: agmatinase [Phycisphaerales bacterium]|nr:agmatinase [Phycisphaerales bacterium]